MYETRKKTDSSEAYQTQNHEERESECIEEEESETEFEWADEYGGNFPMKPKEKGSRKMPHGVTRRLSEERRVPFEANQTQKAQHSHEMLGVYDVEIRIAIGEIAQNPLWRS